MDKNPSIWKAVEYAEADSRSLISLVGEGLNSLYGCTHSPSYWNNVIGLPVRYVTFALWKRGIAADNSTKPLDSLHSSPAGIEEYLPGIPTTASALNLLIMRHPDLPSKLTNLPDCDESAHWKTSPLRAGRVFSRPAQEFSSSRARVVSIQNRMASSRRLLFRGVRTLPRQLLQSLQALPRVVPGVSAGNLPSIATPDDLTRSAVFTTRGIQTTRIATAMNCLRLLLPTSVIEGHQSVERLAASTLADSQPVALVSPGLGEIDRALFALQSENGSRIYMAQHGGHYGESVPSPGEHYERSISTKFISWGWSGNDVQPLPSERLSKATWHTKTWARHDDRSNTPVLWIVNELGLVHSSGFEDVDAYTSRQQELLDSLAPHLIKRLLVRLRPPKLGNDRLAGYHWMSDYGVSFSENGTSAVAEIAKSGIVVIDQPFSTAFLEALALRRPTIVFAPNIIPFVRRSRKDLYQGLIDAGIVVETVAETKRALHEYLEGRWWSVRNRRPIYEDCAVNLARTRRDSPKEWTTFLRTC